MPNLTSTPHSRPPVVTIMGHVDHGKTTLLDAIRHSHLAAKEAGGITQHIGAYQIQHQGKSITFIDTPGHAAFTKMRARGASVTDIIILVVAADDGVKPQTVESIKHIKTAQVPVIVAINKIDLPSASPDKVKAQLTEHQIFCEGYGGQVPAVALSATKKQGLTELLEMILLIAEMENFQADPQGAAQAVIIESRLDPHLGPTATAIVKNGTLKPKTKYYLGTQPVKFRSLTNDLGQNVVNAPPSTPVALTGFAKVPPIGSLLTDQPQSAAAPALTPPPAATNPDPPATNTQPTTETEPEPESELKPPPHLNLILKADTAGTLEAVRQNLAEELIILESGIGPITESDVLLADSTKAFIIGFNVPVSASAQKLAQLEKVKIFTFKIIYELLEFLEKKVLKLLEPTIYEEELGVAEITATFLIRGDKIAGCQVKSGKITKNHPLHLYRRDKLLKDVHLKSLKAAQKDVVSVKAGSECGLTLTDPVDFRPGDVLKSYRIIEK